MKDSINVLLVDDHKMIRDGLKLYLDGSPHIKVVAEAESGLEAIERVKEHHIDVVFMDINMNVMDGITATTEIMKIKPSTKIIAITMQGEQLHIKKMLNAGAVGYMLKSSGQEEVLGAIDRVMSGERYLSEEVTKTIVDALSGASGKSQKNTLDFEADLTKREMEVLEMIVLEYSNNEIADKLFISARTVDAHKRNLLEKTGAKNVAGLVMYAVKNNISNG